MRTDTLQVRSDAVARTPHLLLHALAAAITLGECKAGYDEDDPKLAEQQTKFDDAQHDVVESLAAVCRDAEAFRAMSERPQTIIEAINAVAGLQKAFAIAVDEYLARLEVWRRADAQTGRIRVAVVDRLASVEGGALSKTAADKAASGDPEYTSHKDAVADLADLKDSYELEMKVAAQSVYGAIAMLEAFTALQHSGNVLTITGGTQETTGS